MSNKKYIKVTPKGETEGRVVLASLKQFFISQRAKIEEPTQEEIEAAFPEERAARRVNIPAQAAPPVDKVAVAELNATIEKQAGVIKAQEQAIQDLKKERDAIYEKFVAQSNALKESEELIAKLRAGAEAPAAKGGKKDE